MCLAHVDAEHAKKRALARELLNHWDSFWVVLDHPEPPLTNDTAQRALRHWVIARRRCCRLLRRPVNLIVLDLERDLQHALQNLSEVLRQGCIIIRTATIADQIAPAGGSARWTAPNRCLAG